MEQRFPESLEKRTTSQSFPKFCSLYNFPRGLSKMFECLSFRNFNKFRSYRKLFQEIFVSPTPVSKVQNFFSFVQNSRLTLLHVRYNIVQRTNRFPTILIVCFLSHRFSCSYVQHVLEVFNTNVTEVQTNVGGIFLCFWLLIFANSLTQSCLLRARASEA